MSVSFLAKLTNNSQDSLETIKVFCEKLAKNHQWKGENMTFFQAEETLIGSFKCDWKSAFWVYEDVDFAVQILIQSSEEFLCKWEVYFPEFVGKVAQGKADKGILDMLATFRKMADNQREKTERPQWNPAEKGKKPRATDKKKFQSRWNKEETNKLLKNNDLKNIPLTEKNLTDLRGIEINLQNQLFSIEKSDVSFGKLNGKIALQNSILDFIESENLLIHTLKNCSLVASNISNLQQSMVDLANFLCNENDFSYSKIGEISGNIRLTNAPFIENSVLDYAQIKSIKSAYFKNCSFKNANFNQSEIQHSVFENCDFSGASFDNVHYVKSRFLNCKNLDKNKMNQYVLIFYGEKLSDESDILVE